MKSFEPILKVEGWSSEYKSVQRLLGHLGRKTKSESSRRHYLESLSSLCKSNSKSPDELVSLSKEDAQDAVQSFLDNMKKSNLSIRYINVVLAQLQTFFQVNGFKFNRALELERYYQPSRYRKKAEYIPTDEEIHRMAENAGNLKAKGVILTAYTSGLRNSTLRAVLYGDVMLELEADLDAVLIQVYPEMKKIDPDACKNLLPYVTFISREAIDSIKTYLQEYTRTHGSMTMDTPLFQGNKKGRPMKRRTLEVMVKNAARRAGIKSWNDVTPHCLRKAFERAMRNSGLDSKDQEFLMGHILEGSQDTYYDKTKMDELREKYMRVKFFPISNAEEIRKHAAKDQLRILEALKILPKEELERLRNQLDEKPIDEIDWEAVIEQLKREASNTNNTKRQKAVSTEEAEKLIEQGWRYVGTLPNGKVVLDIYHLNNPVESFDNIRRGNYVF
jgi:integrase